MTNWQSLTIGTAFALFVVWMERQGRWSLFMSAAAGDYVLANSRSTGSGTTSGTVSGSTTPAQSPPNSTRAGTGAPGQATLPGGGGAINPRTGHTYSPPAATSTGSGLG